jgi:tetratricopeptide (TPR) repeat protein
MDSISTNVFDKVTINDLMRIVVGRLRKQKIAVPDIIDQLNAKGVTVTRAKFDDWFMTRPDRDTTAPIAVFQVLLNVLFSLDQRIMTVTELFTLIIAARIPINVIQDYARYFPKAEWNQVLKAYGFHQITWNDTLIGRDEITEVIYESLLRRYSRILVGHPGVGKTALALQVLRHYSVHTGKPTYYIDMRQTTTFMMLLEQLSTVFQVRAMGNEPLLYRLEAFVKHHAPCLLIDDFQDSPSFSLPQFVAYLGAHFPAITFVLTTPLTLTHYPELADKLIEVTPLAYSDNTSPAYHLVRRCSLELGVMQIRDQDIHQICLQAQGNPLYIKMMAGSITRDAHVDLHDDVIQIALTHLDLPSQILLQFMLCASIQLTQSFILAVSPQLIGVDGAAVAPYLQQLTTVGYVTVVQNDEPVYVVANVVRQHLLPLLTNEQVVDMLRCVYTALCQDNDMLTTTVNSNQSLIYRTDLAIILYVGHALISAAMPVEATTLCCVWHDAFIRHGLVAQAIQLGEQCMAALPEADSMRVELELVMGTLYSERGLTHYAKTYFTQVRTNEASQSNQYLRARVAVDQCFIELEDITSAQDAQFVFLCNELTVAVDYFRQQQLFAWQAWAYHRLSYSYFHVNDLRKSHEYNNLAVNLLRKLTPSNWLSDVMRSRGLILTAIGDFASARQHLEYAINAYKESDQVSEIAQSYLRLAVVDVLEMKIPAAVVNLRAGVQILERIGGLKDVLYSIDIYCGVLLAQGGFNDARTLLQICDQLRHERQIYRGGTFDNMLKQYFAFATNNSQIVPRDLGLFMPDQNIYEVVAIMRRQLMTA